MEKNTYTTLCIPRIRSNINKDLIYKIFYKFKLGYILRMTEAPIKNNNDYKRIIITLRWNKENEESMRMQKLIEDGETAKMVYDDPWYWRIVLFKK